MSAFTNDPSLTVNKIMVDSRFRNPSSRSDTDFSIDLPESVYLPVGTHCYVTDVSFVHAWYTIEKDTNDKLYCTFQHGQNKYDEIIVLDSRNYNLDTLVDELQIKFSAMIATAPIWLQLLFSAQVTANPDRGTLSIINTMVTLDSFYIWSDVDLKNETFFKGWNGAYYDPFNPQSINRLIKNYVTPKNNTYKPFVSGFVDTITHHNIYIKSPQLGSFQNIGPQGERDVLKKVLVNVPFGQLVTDEWIHSEDFTDCSRITLRTLNVRITDVNNNIINLNGHHISFSLVFTT